MRCYTICLAKDEPAIYENVPPGSLFIGHEGEHILRVESTLVPQVHVLEFAVGSGSMGTPEKWGESPGEHALNALDEWTRYMRGALAERVTALVEASLSEFGTPPGVCLMAARSNPQIDEVTEEDRVGYTARFECGLVVWATEPKELAEREHTTEFAFQREWVRKDVDILDGKDQFLLWARTQLHEALLG